MGFFDRIDGLDEALNMPGVKMFVIFDKIKNGDYITKAKNHSDRLGQIITSGANINDSIKKCENAMKLIKVVVENERQN